jgi:tetratricopeptide (TPR) repeat protein
MRSIWQWLLAMWMVSLLGGTLVHAGGPLARPRDPLARPRDHRACAHLDRGNQLFDEAREQLAKGSIAESRRAFEDAIAEFKAGQQIESMPVFDYNLGQVFRRLGKYPEAIAHYDRFLSDGQPTGERLASVNALLSEMRAQLANRALTMPPTDPAPAPAPAPRTIAPSTMTARASASPEPRDTGPNWLGWSLTGAGVASIGAAGMLLLSASNLDSQANTDPNVRARNDLHTQADTRTTIGEVVGIAGLALATAGVVDLLLTRSHDRSPSKAASLGIGSNGRDIIVLLHF